jgi:hypothetical protein
MKGLLYMLGFLLIGILMPVAIWVAAAVALFGKRPTPRGAEEPVFQS